jgi:hypothetical protein
VLGGAHIIACAILLSVGVAQAQDPNQIVSQAVQTELAADAADHSLWIYYDVDRKPGANVKEWVAETHSGTLHRVLERNGHAVDQSDQKNGMAEFMQDPGAQAKQRKSDRHDDEQATQMLSLLPKAFVWTKTGAGSGTTTLHFLPDPNFRPPSWESRVFAAMEGDMTVDDKQHRIMSLKGRLIHDVKFGGGLFGELKAGGTFEVARHQLAKGEWQITQTRVHINGYALLFKSISENEDEDKSKFAQLPGNISFADAEKQLLQKHE